MGIGGGDYLRLIIRLPIGQRRLKDGGEPGESAGHGLDHDQYVRKVYRGVIKYGDRRPAQAVDLPKRFQ
jgi:hypothetical protein